VRVYECDVRSDGDVEAAIEGVLDGWGRIDVLVNNAAVFEFGFVEDRALKDTREEFEVNFFGALRTIRAVLPHMRARNEGIVHNVSSGVGLVGGPGLSGYAATKGAIEAFTRSLRLELAREDVSVTVMHPPLTATRSAARLGYPAALQSDPADVGRKLAGQIESTGPVVYADWTVRLGLAVARAVPAVVRRGTGRFLDEHEAVSERRAR
jgi:NAD(P)-dependent dehydrogenase (short-subunit alcohol dehydrogenase family)